MKMKTINRFIGTLIGCILLLMPLHTANAAPMVYEFSGTISSYVDIAGIITDEDIEVGDNVYFTFLIDFELPGYNTVMDGTVSVPVDYSIQSNWRNHDDGPYYKDESGKDFFLSDYLSGSHLSERDGGYYNNANNILEYNSSYDEFYISRYAPNTSAPIEETIWYNGSLYGGSTDETVIIKYGDWSVVENVSISGWQVGDTMTGLSQAYDSQGDYSYYWADLTLDSITAAPVPEPATMLLLGSGIVGLAGFRRKLKK